MKYTFTSRVRYSEVDEHGKLTLNALINYLQDCATFHGEDIGYGFRENMANGQAWVIASLQLHIFEYPDFGTELVTSTWAYRFRGMIGYRNFTVEDAAGKLYAAAKSEWVYMDMQGGKAMNVPAEQVAAYGIEPDLELDIDFGKRKIRLPEGGVPQPSFTVQEHHLDTNRHVNNGQLIRMGQKLLPPGRTVTGLRADFRRQALLGDEILPVLYQTETGWITALNSADGEPYFMAEFTAAENSAG